MDNRKIDMQRTLQSIVGIINTMIELWSEGATPTHKNKDLTKWVGSNYTGVKVHII